MGHNAFDGICIVKDSGVRIESAIASASSRALVGCIDGSLQIYEAQEQQDDDEERRLSSSPYALRRTVVGFAKKAVTQMDLCQSRGGMLITLADAVAIHSLPGLEPVAYLQKTRGATMFSWDELRGLLCVARQKRLLIYRHDGNRDFTEMKDLAVPDVVKSMAWSGDCVCIGYKRDYSLVNINTGSAKDVFPCGRIAPPLVASLPSGELLLGKDNIGVFVDQNGKFRTQLSWAEAPISVVACPPYVLARFSRFVEVRSLREPYGLVQIIPLRDIQFFQSTCFGLLAGSEHCLYKMEPVPLGAQVVQLAASGKFEDALALCKLFPPEDAALRSSKENAIHIRYGQYLFNGGQYGEALQHLAMSSLSISSIVSLFPSIKLPSFCSDEVENEEDLDTATGDSVADQKEISTVALTSLANFLTSKRGPILEKISAQDTTDAIAELVERNFDRRINKTKTKMERSAPKKLAAVLDTALVQALLQTNQSAVALQLLKGVNYCDVEACREMMLAGGHFEELLEMYQYNKMHQEALELLTRLFEEPETFPVPPQPGQFGPDVVVNYLKPLAAEDPHSILEFASLVLKVSPEQAMVLFTSTDPPLPASLVLAKLRKHAPNLKVVYMEEMLKHDPSSLSADIQSDMVQLYLWDVLEERSGLQTEGKWNEWEYSESRNKLLNALENLPSYNPQAVFRQLPGDGLYQERAVLFGRMKQHHLALSLYVHKLHDPQKALAYCDRVFQSAKLQKQEALLLNTSFDQEAANVYLALLEIYLKPKSSIKDFNSSIFRLGLSKTGKTGNKLKGHVARKVTQIEEAQSFGGANDSTAESGRSDSEEGIDAKNAKDGVMLQEAIQLLCSKWDCFDGAQVLQMLPSEAKLQDLLPFLEPLLRRSIEKSRNAAVIRKVNYSDNVEVRYDLLQRRKRVVKVTNDRSCFICRKKIGTSVFAVYPSGALAHFVCYSERSK